MNTQTKKDALTYKNPSLYTPRGDSRRIAILEATVDAIATGDLAEVNFERIAKRCKIRRSLIVYYFEDPASLLRSTVEYALSFGQEFAVAHLTEASTSESRLTAFVHANFVWLEKYPKHAAVFGLLNYLAVCAPSYQALHKALSDMAERRLGAILLGGPLKRNAKKLVPETAATLRTHLIASLARRHSMAPKQAFEKDEKEVIRAFFKLSENVWES